MTNIAQSPFIGSSLWAWHIFFVSSISLLLNNVCRQLILLLFNINSIGVALVLHWCCIFYWWRRKSMMQYFILIKLFPRLIKSLCRNVRGKYVVPFYAILVKGLLPSSSLPRAFRPPPILMHFHPFSHVFTRFYQFSPIFTHFHP